MIKRGILLLLAGSFGVGFSFSSQQATSVEATSMKPILPFSGTDTLALYQMLLFNKADSSALIRELPMNALLNGDCLPFSNEMARMGTVSLGLFSEELPSVDTQIARVSVKTQNEGKDFAAEGKDFKSPGMVLQPRPLHYSGEVGFLYGRSTGKFSGDEKQAYAIGEVDDGNTQITVGVSYDDSNFHLPRHGR